MAATCVVIWAEKLDAQGRIVFWWNGRNILAEDAFHRLQTLLVVSRASQAKVVLSIKGHLGQDVRWEASLAMTPRQAARQVFGRWYTQAVQAQAALVRQRVQRPPIERGSHGAP